MKANETVINAELQNFKKILSWKDPCCSSVNHDVANKPYRINMCVCVCVCV